MVSPSGGALVLIVDDQVDHLEMYRIALEHAGFAVDEAVDGGSALSSVNRNLPDVIVLDLRLPDISGWQVCEILKSDPRTAVIPIIILTAADSPSLAHQAAQSGCAAFLLKPCVPEDLIRTVQQVLATT